MGPRNDDLRPLGRALDLDHVGLNAVTHLEPLTVHLLRRHQHRLGFAEVHEGCASLEPLHDAGDNVALAIGELLVDHPALRLADPLDHNLLGGLGGDTPKVARRDLRVDVVAGRTADHLLSLPPLDLALGIDYLVDDG